MEAVKGRFWFIRDGMQGCMIQVRLLQSMHAQDQQRQDLSLEENGRRPLISSVLNISRFNVFGKVFLIVWTLNFS